jgi:roadblock/LC7 domain-containing protein
MVFKLVRDLVKTTCRILLYCAAASTLAVTTWAQAAAASSAGFDVEETNLGPYSGSSSTAASLIPSLTTPPPTLVALSSDGTHIAYTSTHGCPSGAKLCIDLDNSQAIPVDDGVSVQGLLLNRSGQRVAYIASRGKKVWLVVDGHAGAHYDDLWSATFSPDGRRIAYAARQGKHRTIMVDGLAGANFDELLGLQFSADSTHVAFAGRLGKQWTAVLDGRQGPMYKTISNLALSFDGKRMAYAAQVGKLWTAVVDGQPGVTYKGISTLVFSPDGVHFAYTAQPGKQWTLVSDGTPGTMYDAFAVGSPAFSQDGREVVYAAQKNKQWTVVMQGPFSAAYAAEGAAGGLTISPDGEHVAYVDSKRVGLMVRGSIAVDGKPGPVYTGVGVPAFSPDGKHLAYIAYKPFQVSVVLDGQATTVYNSILGDFLTFSPDDALEVLALKGSGGLFPLNDVTLYRVKYTQTP